MRRLRRVEVRPALEEDVTPGECPQLLGSGTGQQRDDGVRVHRGSLRTLEYGLGLGKCERLGRAPGLPLRHRAQLNDIALHLVPCHGPLDRAVEAGMDSLERTRAECLRFGGQPAVYVRGWCTIG